MFGFCWVSTNYLEYKRYMVNVYNFKVFDPEVERVKQAVGFIVLDDEKNILKSYWHKNELKWII